MKRRGLIFSIVQGADNIMIKKKYYIAIIALIYTLIAIIGIKHYNTKLTYIETEFLNDSSDRLIQVCDNETEIIQKFKSNYELISGIELKIGTNGRINNSKWNISIVDPLNEKTLCNTIVYASQITDGNYNNIEFDNRNIKIIKNKSYEIHISSIDADELSSLAFFSSASNVIDGELTVNGLNQVGSICMKINGGDIDYWWVGLFIVLMIWFLFILVLYIYNGAEGLTSIKKDKLLQALILSFVVFLLSYSFAYNTSMFTDENDNIRGGLIIARGGVLYRDFVSQHTPIAYYLCALFAIFGASSVTQMRICYYLANALLWGGLYIRHSAFFGRKRMLLLPMIETVLTFSMLWQTGFMILSDNIQGMCMVALVIEFIRYLDDMNLGWIRSIIASLFVWMSIGVAFVSLYSVFAIFLLLIVAEGNWWKCKQISLRTIIGRYYKLIISILTPLCIVLLYFKFNHALRLAYEYSYVLNTEVYPYYKDGFGSNVFQPFMEAFVGFFGIVGTNIKKIITAQSLNYEVIELLVLLLFIVVLVKLQTSRKYLLSILLFFTMCLGATRGYEELAHSAQAWYVAILTISLYGGFSSIKQRMVETSVCACLLVFMASVYFGELADCWSAKQYQVSDLETKVIELTNDGDGIFVDTFACDSIYLFYKNRYPVNRIEGFVPWVMDWDEQSAIDDLINNMPKVVIYNPDGQVYGITHFSNRFANELSRHYAQLSANTEDGWKFVLWTKIE